MADEEKTEAPTPRRRQEARERGHVSRSQDLSAGVLLLVGLLVLWMFNRYILSRLFNIMHYLLGGSGDSFLQVDQLFLLGRWSLLEVMQIVLPILALLMVAGIAVSLLQVGPLWTVVPVTPDFNKINPVNGFRTLFNARTVVKLLICSFKLGVVGYVVYDAVIDSIDRILFLSQLAVPEMLKLGMELMLSLGIRAALVLLVLGILDYLYERYKYERDLRMSKEEVKEEMKRMDGDPLMRRRRREVQMQLSMQRIRKEVPQADVVVTNPTHYAVALRYDNQEMHAPRVVAKGQDYMALRIREIALEFEIPVVERPPLARTLYQLVEVGHEIPPSLYKAVAEVLAYVYELSGRRQQMRETVAAATT